MYHERMVGLQFGAGVTQFCVLFFGNRYVHFQHGMYDILRHIDMYGGWKFVKLPLIKSMVANF